MHSLFKHSREQIVTGILKIVFRFMCYAEANQVYIQVTKGP